MDKMNAPLRALHETSEKLNMLEATMMAASSTL
jgi:hypothetical protein